jgi:RNA polymerase sigma factor (sigma-70 family)
VGKQETTGNGGPRGRDKSTRGQSAGNSPLEGSSGLYDLAPAPTEDPEAIVARARRTNGSSVSALSAFQRSADRFPPLSAEEQLAMVARHREVRDKTAKLRASNRARERQRLRELEREEARLVEHLCASCWRLAWVIVREQAEERFGRDRATDMLPDLLAEANYSLVKAVHDFDPTQTPKFATYAARVIRDHTRAVLSREGYMRLAPSWGRVKRLATTRMPELVHELGRKPTTQELQDDLLKRCLEWAEDHLTDDQKNLPAAQRKKLALAKLRKQGMLGAIRDIEEILVVSQSMVSLDGTIGEEGGATLGDTVVAERPEELMDNLERSELHDAIMKALGGLTEREQEIVLLRYGFDGSEGWTYSAIAEKFGVSSERIRQIERGALEKLNSPESGFSAFASYLGGHDHG